MPRYFISAGFFCIVLMFCSELRSGESAASRHAPGGNPCGTVSPRQADAVVNLDRALVRQLGVVRFATFNVSLAGQREGEIQNRLESGDDKQAKAVAAIIQRVRPDVLFVNELDFDPGGAILAAFAARYLAVPQRGGTSTEPTDGIRYPYRFTAPVNTGLPSPFDLNRDGVIGAPPGSDAYGQDAWGYGRYPGQYGMAILSRYPLIRDEVRTFQHCRWRDMPGALLPEDSRSGQTAPWYDDETLAQFPLSSKSHWDVPVRVSGRVVHLLASHPTPPVFDGPEDRNGRRNHDEIRFWCDYLTPRADRYIGDDHGRQGGLAKTASFVILGDLNSDPSDGSDPRLPVRRLLEHARVSSRVVPRSRGGVEHALRQAGANADHKGDPAADTGDFPDSPGPGNLRLDYVLPSRDLTVAGGGVFWPLADSTEYALVGPGFPIVSSDHRLVWLDIRVDAPVPTQGRAPIRRRHR